MFFEDLLANKILWTAAAATLIAQVLKVLIHLALYGSWQPARFLESGGMPSSHTASVTALATACGIKFGFDSIYFAISTVFALIVMYDATGIRRAAGQQATLLNDLIDELRAVISQGFAPKPLKELLGHSYLEVFVGLLFGVATALVASTMS